MARAEQEIRAYPRLHAAFYGAVTRNPVVRDVVGRLKDRVRGGGAAGSVVLPSPFETQVRARRAASVAARLRLGTP